MTLKPASRDITHGARQTYEAFIARVLMPLLLAGCAAISTESGIQTANQARAVVQEIVDCATANGATLATASAKPQADRTNQEQALIEADRISRDLAVLTGQLEGVQGQLNNKLPEQRAAEEQLNKLLTLQQSFNEGLGHFVSAYTRLDAVSQALAQVKNDQSESLRYINEVAHGTVQVMEGMSIVAAPVLIGELIGSGIAEDRLRRDEVRVVQEMLAQMQTLRDLTRQYGIEASGLTGPMAQAQNFINQVNSGAEFNPRNMLRGMGDALREIFALRSDIKRQVESAQANLDSIIRQTQDLFRQQNEINAKINHALDRANLAQAAACRYSPFEALPPSFPGWNTTFWDISSP